VFDHGEYRLNRTRSYHFDVDLFEADLAQAARTQADAPDRAIALLEHAVSLYQGDFVEDFLEGEWFLLRREELRRKYLEAWMTLGKLHLVRRDYARAAEAFRRAIEKDPVLEQAHRELMRSYARSGERGLALRQFESLEQAMREELGSPPAAESLALYERLKRGEDV
jgi:DNA-binding SARP family transcriptional activator